MKEKMNIAFVLLFAPFFSIEDANDWSEGEQPQRLSPIAAFLLILFYPLYFAITLTLLLSLFALDSFCSVFGLNLKGAK